MSVVVAFDTVIPITGTISGPCSANANVSVIGFCSGQLGNYSCIENWLNTTSNAVSNYGLALTDFDPGVDGAGAVGLDIFVEVTNSACSPTAHGNNSLPGATGSPVINVTMTNPFSLDLPVNGSTVTNQTINFSWTNNIISPNSTVQIDNNSNFASIDETRSNILTPNITIATSLLDGIYFWRVLTYRGSTFIQQSGVNNFTLANDAPSIVTVSPNTSTWVSATSTTLLITTDLPATCAYATTASVAYNSKTVFSTTGSTTSHSTSINLLSNGVNNFYVQCNGSNGRLMPVEVQINVNRDTLVPDESAATVSINSGASYSTNTTVNVSWAGFVDATSSIVGYYVNTTNNEGTTIGEFTSGSSLLVSNLSDGINTIYVWGVDAAGNIGLASSDSISIDTQVPTFGSWSTSPINLNQFTISDITIYVTISDTLSLPTLPQLRYAIGSDGFTAAADMTLVAGSIYSFEIPNQASPNDWANRAGENLTYIVNATDLAGFSSNSTQTTFINDQFNAPVFTPLSSFSQSQGANFSISLAASDVDGDTLVFTSTNSNISITSTSSTTANAYWSPTNDDVGTNILFFTVTDGYFNVSQAVIVNITNVNDEPILSLISDLSAYEYQEFTYTLNASDVDGDTLRYSTNTSLFVVGSSSGAITFTPTATQRGTHEIAFTVSDGNGGYDRENVTFTVLYCGDSVVHLHMKQVILVSQIVKLKRILKDLLLTAKPV